jgi:hypothetical protein
MDLKLWDRTALVTGSSDGIGGAVAKIQPRRGIAEVRSRRRTMEALVFVVALVLLAAFVGGTSGPRVVTAADGDRFSEPDVPHSGKAGRLGLSSRLSRSARGREEMRSKRFSRRL